MLRTCCRRHAVRPDRRGFVIRSRIEQSPHVAAERDDEYAVAVLDALIDDFLPLARTFDCDGDGDVTSYVVLKPSRPVASGRGTLWVPNTSSTFRELQAYWWVLG
jgi:hypothetical protein